MFDSIPIMQTKSPSKSVLTALILVLFFSPLISSAAGMSMMNMAGTPTSETSTPDAASQATTAHCQELQRKKIAESIGDLNADQQDRAACCDSPCQCDAMGCYTSTAISTFQAKFIVLSRSSYRVNAHVLYTAPFSSPSFPPPIS